MINLCGGRLVNSISIVMCCSGLWSVWLDAGTIVGIEFITRRDERFAVVEFAGKV